MIYAAEDFPEDFIDFYISVIFLKATYSKKRRRERDIFFQRNNYAMLHNESRQKSSWKKGLNAEQKHTQIPRDMKTSNQHKTFPSNLFSFLCLPH